VYTGANIDRYTRAGFQWSMLPNDASFISHWAWFPAYRLTNDRRYLDAATRVANWIARVIEEHGYLPAWYRQDTGQWQRRVMIDSGFAAEVFCDLYIETGDPTWYHCGIRFIDGFSARLRAGDGLFYRAWFENGRVNQVIFTRGQAWVLEGLLAAWEMTGDEKYLHEAQLLASRLLRSQKRNGSWNVYLNMISGECDKGTPVIAYNLLRLHRACPNATLVEAALRAVQWCNRHQYIGSDLNAKGGIFSRNVGGGIIDNFPYIRGSAPYAVAFYILSLVELAGLGYREL
jgi:uncharacterized protein YyaL (SSP411 family)